MNIRDLLLGVAVADAVGNPLEFMNPVTQKDVAASCSDALLQVSDDTQMTLFLAESLTKCANFSPKVRQELQFGYMRWYITQTKKYSPHVGFGLLAYPELYSIEAPGDTCMKSMRDITKGGQAKNDSKGNGTVMRCSPLALYAKKWWLTEDALMALAAMDAAITHKHPFATYSSQFQSLTLYYLLAGEKLEQAIRKTAKVIGAQSHLSISLNDFLTLIARAVDSDSLQMGGWVAEEALCLALHAALHGKGYMDIMTRAITTSGDSDTVAAIAGALAAAMGHKPPKELVRKLNVQMAIDYVSLLPQWSEPM